VGKYEIQKLTLSPLVAGDAYQDTLVVELLDMAGVDGVLATYTAGGCGADKPMAVERDGQLIVLKIPVSQTRAITGTVTGKVRIVEDGEPYTVLLFTIPVIP
jgi:protein-disulfide isomerase